MLYTYVFLFCLNRFRLRTNNQSIYIYNMLNFLKQRWTTLVLNTKIFSLRAKQLNKKIKFIFFLFLMLYLILLGIYMKTPNVTFLIYYCVFFIVLYFFKDHITSNRHLHNFLSESNIGIRLLTPVIIYLLFEFNIVIICIAKLTIILIIRAYFSCKLTRNSIIFTFIFCIFSSFVSPVISAYLIELYIYSINPLGMLPINQHHLPDWLRRAQENYTKNA